MNPRDEARYQAARQQLAGSPDDLAVLREFAESAKLVGKRPEAVDALKAAYARRGTPELYGDLRTICTFPEFQAIKPPSGAAAGPKVQAGTGAEILPLKPFPLLLDQVVFYPVQDGLSVFLLICCTILLAAGDMMIRHAGIIGYGAAIILWGIPFGYFWSVLHASGMGEKRTRGWPDFSDPGEFGTAVGQYFMVFVACYGPALLFLFFAPLDEEQLRLRIVGTLALGLLGVCYWPMALMMAGFTHSVAELFNFPSAIRSVSKIPLDYVICLGFFVGSYILVVVFEIMLVTVAAKAPLPLWIAIMLLIRVIETYLLIVQMRTAGLLYYAREKDLGWFQ